MTIYYVTLSGDDSTGDGLSEGTAFRTPGRAGAETTDDDVIAIKSGAGIYARTNNVSNTANGPCYPLGARVQVIGYQTSPFDNGIKPVLVDQNGGNAGTIRTRGGHRVSNLRLEMDHSANNATLLLADGQSPVTRDIEFHRTSSGTGSRAVNSASGTSSILVDNSRVTGAFAFGIQNCRWVTNCVLDGVEVGIHTTSTQFNTILNCIVRNGTTGISAVSANGSLIMGNIVDSMSGNGYQVDNASNSEGDRFLYNGAIRCGGYGFRNLGATDTCVMQGNYYYETTSGVQDGFEESGTIALTADPFVDAASGDYRLNDTAGGGAVLRAVELPMMGLANSIYAPFRQWAHDIGGGASGPRRPRQGNLLGRSF